MKKDFLEVSIAIILKENQALLGFRKDYKLWEFPGGKIEIQQKETPEEAIKREIFEEIGIQIEVPSTHGVCFAESRTGQRYIFHIFKIKNWEGTPESKVHGEIKWVNLQEIHRLKTHELNEILLPHIL